MIPEFKRARWRYKSECECNLRSDMHKVRTKYITQSIESILIIKGRCSECTSGNAKVGFN